MSASVDLGVQLNGIVLSRCERALTRRGTPPSIDESFSVSLSATSEMAPPPPQKSLSAEANFSSSVVTISPVWVVQVARIRRDIDAVHSLHDSTEARTCHRHLRTGQGCRQVQTAQFVAFLLNQVSGRETPAPRFAAKYRRLTYGYDVFHFAALLRLLVEEIEA